MKLRVRSYQKMIGSLAVLSMLAMAGTAMAQTTATTTDNSSTYTGTTGTTATGSTGTTSTTPGAPNTGAGGDAASNLLLLGTSGVIALLGGAYLARKSATAHR